MYKRDASCFVNDKKVHVVGEIAWSFEGVYTFAERNMLIWIGLSESETEKQNDELGFVFHVQHSKVTVMYVNHKP